MKKTTAFNLLIIDESGSMSHLVQQTIDGCNETLNVIRSLQNANPDTQRCLASIYLFQTNAENPSHYVVKNRPITEVKNLDTSAYRPCGCTPLLDAVGSTLTDLEAAAETHEDAACVVTIITDGAENSSSDYTWQQVAAMIDRLKEKGWTFNFIGANIDVASVSRQMNIDNAMAFETTVEGSRKMWSKYKSDLADFESQRIAEESERPGMSPAEKMKLRKLRSQGFFK